MQHTDQTEQQKKGPVLQIGQIINQQFQVISTLGSGSFGEVYLGKDLANDNQVAIKVELPNSIPSQLNIEANILRQFQQYEGFPQIYWNGTDENQNLILVMELLGQDLYQNLLKSRGKMSLKTVLMLIDQMLKRIETLHNKNYLYRDMKPENWMLGKGKFINTVYLIDFGLVKKYKDKNGQHIKYKENKGLIGTARFVSINTHLGYEQSRRDDLESLGYIWIYLIKGQLPWQGLRAETREEKHEKLKQKKMAVPIEQLCSKLPQEFVQYFRYCRSLKFEEQPDYRELKTKFKDLFFKLYDNWDFIWDWIILSSDGQNIQSCNCNQDGCHICIEQKEQQLRLQNIEQKSEYQRDIISSSNLDSAYKSQRSFNNISTSKKQSQYSLSQQKVFKILSEEQKQDEIIQGNQNFDEQNIKDVQKNLNGHFNFKEDFISDQQQQLQQQQKTNQNQTNSIQNPVKKLSFLSGLTNPKINIKALPTTINQNKTNLQNIHANLNGQIQENQEKPEKLGTTDQKKENNESELHVQQNQKPRLINFKLNLNDE
ncbi:Protein kinase-like domain [Pseudocohnilembus persalinus]|uniref:Casein kinase I n=1 Tax=Pseudocohnilembus persalinus TaxID=266149 RepID=A0A0V0R3B3_PSEPJ|nr:Protein kinase-like domain [Pseudocohnilembus persalinus]|eukprot:KRX08998.1 Protein kinase-like domain [Pseudocohnilembus persalinus]